MVLFYVTYRLNLNVNVNLSLIARKDTFFSKFACFNILNYGHELPYQPLPLIFCYYGPISKLEWIRTHAMSHFHSFSKNSKRQLYICRWRDMRKRYTHYNLELERQDLKRRSSGHYTYIVILFQMAIFTKKLNCRRKWCFAKNYVQTLMRSHYIQSDVYTSIYITICNFIFIETLLCESEKKFVYSFFHRLQFFPWTLIIIFY